MFDFIRFGKKAEKKEEPIKAVKPEEVVELQDFYFENIDETSEENKDKKCGMFNPPEQQDSTPKKWAKLLTGYFAFIFTFCGLLASILVWILPMFLTSDLTVILIVLFILTVSFSAMAASLFGFVLGALRFKTVFGILSMFLAIVGIVSTSSAFVNFWNILKAISIATIA